MKLHTYRTKVIYLKLIQKNIQKNIQNV